MSASKDRAEPLVMVEVREYVMGPRMSMTLCCHQHPIVRNDEVGPRARTRRQRDGSIEILH